MKLASRNIILLLAGCYLVAGHALADKNVFNNFIRSARKNMETILLKERDVVIKTGLAVHITNKSGDNLQNVKVALNDRILAFSDSKGICAFLDVRKGIHNVEISAHGYAVIKDANVKYDPASPWAAPREYKLKALPTTMVVGIEDRGGIPLEGVTVKMAGEEIQTSEKGVARFNNILLDNATPLTAQKPGFIKVRKTLILSPDNWSTEVYQSIVLQRKKQFELNGAFQVNDPQSLPQNNGDGKANAGESIKLPVKISNISDEMTDSWTLAFRCDSPHIEFQEKPTYENKPLKPGEERGFLIPINIKSSVNKIEVLKVVATIIPKNDFFGAEQKTFPLPVHPGELLKFKLMIDPIVQDQVVGNLSQRNNGNNMLGPGEYGTIRLTIGNLGEAVKNVQFYLETLPSDLIDPRAIKQHNQKKNGVTMQANQLMDAVFKIDVPRDYDYSLIPLFVMAESHGRVWGERFAIPVEGKSDFHASIAGKGQLARGGVFSFTIKMTYSGSESFKGNLVLSSESKLIKTKPEVFRGRTIVPDKTMELTGMMTIPSNYSSDTFKLKFKIRDMGLGNAEVFSKDFMFKLKKQKRQNQRQ